MKRKTVEIPSQPEEGLRTDSLSFAIFCHRARYNFFILLRYCCCRFPAVNFHPLDYSEHFMSVYYRYERFEELI